MKTVVWHDIVCGLAALGALSGAALVCGPARAADYNVGSIHVTQPWARATPKGASTAAAYMTITNDGTKAVRLSCVSSNVSKECQIHSMTVENGVMKMRPVVGGLEIKPGATLSLKPGGYHIMLIDLSHPLMQGQSIEATLKFDNAATVKVDYPVAGIGAAAPGAPAGGGSMNMPGPGGGKMQMK